MHFVRGGGPGPHLNSFQPRSRLVDLGFANPELPYRAPRIQGVRTIRDLQQGFNVMAVAILAFLDRSAKAYAEAETRQEDPFMVPGMNTQDWY